MGQEARFCQAYSVACLISLAAFFRIYSISGYPHLLVLVNLESHTEVGQHGTWHRASTVNLQ
jgi:hypothetical protein